MTCIWAVTGTIRPRLLAWRVGDRVGERLTVVTGQGQGQSITGVYTEVWKG